MATTRTRKQTATTTARTRKPAAPRTRTRKPAAVRKPRVVTLKGTPENIESIYLLASEEERRIGRTWYPGFLADIVATAGAAGFLNPDDSVPMLAGITAAFSIQRSPNNNLVALDAFVRDRITGGNSRTKKARYYHSSMQDGKARKIWAGVDPMDALRGPKERAFAGAIAGDTESVVIDGHAWCVWTGKRESTSTVKVPSKGPQRVACEEAYRTVARKYHVSASVIQATTWIVWRRLHQGEVTLKQLRSTVSGDFATVK